MIRTIVHFTGRVQGVGFRYRTTRIARNHNITGYVKNLPDRRVEMVVEGLPNDVRQFIKDVQSQLADHIKETTQNNLAPSGQYASFSIER